MTKQECIQTMDIALKYLGLDSGTVWDVEMELYKRTNIARTTTIHVYIKNMLVILGVTND